MRKDNKPTSTVGFMVIYAFFQITSGFIHPVVPTLIVLRDFHSYMFGVILAAMSMANFIFSPFWGNLCNYVSSKYIMFICSIGYIGGQLLFGYANTEASIVVARLISGTFFGGITVSSLNYIINTSNENKSVYLVAASTIQSVGFAIGYFVGGVLGEVSVITPFISQAICMVVCALLFILYCNKNDGFKQTMPKRSVFIKESNPLSVLVSAKNLISGILSVFLLCVFIACFGQTSFDQSFNYYLKDIFDLSPIYNGVIRAVSAILSLIVNSTIGIILLKKTNHNKTFVWLLGLCTLIFFSIFIFKSLLIYIIITVVSLALNALRAPMQQDIILKKVKDEDSNVLMGFYQAINAIGSMAAALTAGFTYDLWNNLPFLIGGICLLASTLLATVFLRTDKTVENI